MKNVKLTDAHVDDVYHCLQSILSPKYGKVLYRVIEKMDKKGDSNLFKIHQLLTYSLILIGKVHNEKV